MALVAGLSASLLSGCTTDVGSEAVQAQTPAPGDQSPTPTPVSTPADTEQPAAPEIDLAHPASWLISADGIGPVLYGGSISDVRPSMSVFAEIPSDWCSAARFRSEENGLALLTMLGEDGSTIEGLFVSGWGSAQAAQANSPHTAEGIGLGSSLSDLLSAYPTITMSRERATEPPTLYYAFQNDNDSYLVFAVYEDVVSAIAVHDEPWLMSEYCA